MNHVHNMLCGSTEGVSFRHEMMPGEHLGLVALRCLSFLGGCSQNIFQAVAYPHLSVQPLDGFGDIPLRTKNWQIKSHI